MFMSFSQEALINKERPLDSELLNNIYNPYYTTYGKTFNKAALTKTLTQLTTSNEIFGSGGKEKLSYGLKFKTFIPLVITGKFEDEKDVPPFSLPFPFINHKDELYLAFDLREYISKPENISALDYDGLISAIHRPENVELLFRMGKLMEGYAEEEFDMIPFKDSIKLYVFVVTTILKGIIALDIKEEDQIRVLTAAFFYLLNCKDTFPTTDIDDMSAFMRKNLLIATLGHNDIKELIISVKIEAENIANEKLKTIDTLLDWCASCVSTDKKALFKGPLLINRLTTLWRGAGKNFAAIASVECLPIFLSLVYESIENKVFKFSPLASLIQKDRNADKKNFSATIKTNFKYI